MRDDFLEIVYHLSKNEGVNVTILKFYLLLSNTFLKNTTLFKLFSNRLIEYYIDKLSNEYSFKNLYSAFIQYNEHPLQIKALFQFNKSHLQFYLGIVLFKYITINYLNYSYNELMLTKDLLNNDNNGRLISNFGGSLNLYKKLINNKILQKNIKYFN